MTLETLTTIANKAYDAGSGLVLDYFHAPETNHGDGLAKFIAVELQDTYDDTATDAAQREEAARVIRAAAAQLEAVAAALEAP